MAIWPLQYNSSRIDCVCERVRRIYAEGTENSVVMVTEVVAAMDPLLVQRRNEGSLTG